MATKKPPKKTPAKKKPVKRNKKVSASAPMPMNDGFHVRKAENGFIVSFWNQKSSREITHIAKNKVELGKLMAKMGIG